MAEIVNLRMARKRVKRAEKADRADARRAEFGTGGAERRLAKLTSDKHERDLDGRKLSTDPAPERE